MNDDFFLSQIGQDKFIIEEVFKHKKRGYFVDVGAFDGITISNTYVLEKHFEWEGICVEPSGKFKKLELNRSCHCENACLADSEGDIEFVERGWDSFGKGYGKHKVDGGRQIKTKTLASVLRKYDAPSVIDYLSVDVEGMEYDILKNFCYQDYVFKAITVEHNNDIELKNNLFNLLTSMGYRCVLCPGIESWYLHESVDYQFDGQKYAEMYYKKWHELWGCLQQVKKQQHQHLSPLRRLLGIK